VEQAVGVWRLLAANGKSIGRTREGEVGGTSNRNLLSSKQVNWGDWITKAAAALGAGLGILNTWNAWRQGKVRIRVVPTSVAVLNLISTNSMGQAIYGRFLSPGIAVINLGSFPVTLEEVGYEFKDGEKYPLTRIADPNWSSGVSEKLPQRLEAHASVRMSLWVQEEETLKGLRIRRAYARTACGTTVCVRNHALRRLTEQLTRGEPLMERVEKAH
jgi:hypothetical protein